MRVLVVEDHARLADSVARVPRREGMAVDVAYDGTAAVERTAALAADVLRATGTELRVAADLRPARAIGDPVLIERLLANLIDNAVSHHVPGGSVEVATAG